MLELTPDGSLTAYSQRFGQHYHNRHGAYTQAQHVYLDGTHTSEHPAPHILEIGFGVGMNFLTTLQDVSERHVPLHYMAYEFDPVDVSVLQAIGARHPAGQHPLWLALLSQWPSVAANPFSTDTGIPIPKIELHDQQCYLTLYWQDVTQATLPINWASAVYLDGFSPDANPELWSPALMKQIAQAMQSGGWLSTYSAAGAVKRALRAAGLQVQKRMGMTGKREHVQAQKP